MADISKIQIESGTYNVKDEIARNGLNYVPEYIRNVKHYGAIGDGVHDDTIAIQTAIEDNQYGTIYFPDGVYLITAPIKTYIDNDKQTNIKLEKNAIVKTNNLIECLFELGGLGGNNEGVVNRLRFFIGGVLDANNCNYGIKINSEAIGIIIQDCEIKGFNNYGIYAPNGQTVYSSDLSVINCYINGKGSHLENTGIYINRPDNKFENIRINACKKGFYLTQGGQFIHNVHCLGIGEGSWFNDTIFIDMQGGSDNIITDSYCDTMQTFIRNYSNNDYGMFTLTNSTYYSYISNVDCKLFIFNNSNTYGTHYIIKNNTFMLPTASNVHQGIIYNNFGQQTALKANQVIIEDNLFINSTQLSKGDLLLTTHKRYKPFWSRPDLNLPTDRWLKIGYVITNTYSWYDLSIDIDGYLFSSQFKVEKFGSTTYLTKYLGYKNHSDATINIGVKYEGNTNGVDVYGLYIKPISTLKQNVEVKSNNDNVPFMQMSTDLFDPTFEDITMDDESVL